MDLQKSLDRLEKAIGKISKSPKTALAVSLLFEDFAATLEGIAEDLATKPDEQVARELREIIERYYTSRDI